MKSAFRGSLPRPLVGRMNREGGYGDQRLLGGICIGANEDEHHGRLGGRLVVFSLLCFLFYFSCRQSARVAIALVHFDRGSLIGDFYIF